MTNEDRMAPLPPTNSSQESKSSAMAHTAATAASDVAGNATSAAKDAAGEAVTQAKVVAGEAKRQLSTVLDQTKQELTQQADERARRAAGGLRTLADQTAALASGRPMDAGPLTDYLDEVQTKLSSFAERLETRGPQGVLDDVSSFARRRPMMFLAAAAGAGFAVARLARAGQAVHQAEEPDPTPVTGVTTPPPRQFEAPTPGFEAPYATTAP